MDQAHTNPPAPGEAEVVMEKLVYGGDGLARSDGRVVLAPFTLPGERVRVSLEREKSDMARGRLLAILEPSPVRIPPRCPHFTRCGGCHYQHAPYEYELAQKEAILRETLRRVGRLEPPDRIDVISGPEFGYRNRAQFHFDRGRAGFMSAASHALCPVEACPVSSPRLNQALAELGAMAGEGRFPPFLRSIELFTNETEVQLQVRASDRGVARPFFDWCAERIPGATTGPLDYAAAGGQFRVSPRSFFQVNRFLVGRLVEIALQDAGGDAALELYAGVGLFTLPLARRFARVDAVESGGGAARDLAFNAARAGLSVQIHHADVEAYLGGTGQRPEFVLADPPRAGLGRRVAGRLLALGPANLVIVSCDPATLARDLAPLVEGGYRLSRLTLVDLFPRTYHLETVAALKLC